MRHNDRTTEAVMTARHNEIAMQGPGETDDLERRRGLPIARRHVFAGLGLAIALPLLGVMPQEAFAAHTLGKSFNVETHAKNSWTGNFQKTLDGIPFDLSFRIMSAKKNSDRTWTVSVDFYKDIYNPLNNWQVWFNAAVMVYVDGKKKMEFGPGKTTRVNPKKHVRAYSDPLSVKIPNGGKVHITSKGRNYESGITSVGKNYFDFYLVAPTYYVVTFKPGYGENKAIKTQEVKKGGNATAPSNPTREGYTFSKWDKSYKNVSANITVTAVWKTKAYTVRFLPGYGANEPIETQTVNWGADATAPANPTRAGWEFTGWDRGFANVKSDIDVTALWEPAAIVRYYADGELMHSQGGLTPGADVSVPAAAIAACRREGCTPGWTGWFTDAACTKRWEGGKVPAGTLNLYSYNELTLSFGATVDSAPTAGEFRTHPDADAPVATLIPAPRTVRYEASASLSLPQACYRNDGDGRWRTYRAEGYFGTPQGSSPQSGITPTRDTALYLRWRQSAMDGILSTRGA